MQQDLIISWILIAFSNTVHDSFSCISLNYDSPRGRRAIVSSHPTIALCSLLLIPLMLSYLLGISICFGERVDTWNIDDHFYK